MHRSIWLGVLGAAAMSVVFATASSQPSVPGGDLGAQLSRLAGAYHDFGEFDGAVLVARDGRVLFSRAYGAANREWAVPNAVDTRFRIVSMTKSVTGILVLQLVDSGRIALDATVTRYLPDSIVARETAFPPWSMRWRAPLYLSRTRCPRRRSGWRSRARAKQTDSTNGCAKTCRRRSAAWSKRPSAGGQWRDSRDLAAISRSDYSSSIDSTTRDHVGMTQK